MATKTVTTEIAKQAPPSAGKMVSEYRDSFAAVVPSHINADSWVRIAQSALKRGKKVDAPGQDNVPVRQRRKVYELELAAQNNPAVFLSAMLDAARLGLEPGTEEYYLTPRKEKGQLQILGIVGYQGYIELMYRAGAVQSVVAECVYSNDHFSYQPGRNDIPNHEIDWDAEDRGTLRLVYAYAPMKGGGYSKVIVLNKHDISRIKSKAQGANTEYSPWNTDEPSMWLKSAVRQLRKWVPTSREYVREQLRAQKEIEDESRYSRIPNPNGGGIVDVSDLPVASDASDVIEGEVIEHDDEPDPGYTPNPDAEWAAQVGGDQ